MQRLTQLHPFLFASYGSLALLASNLGQIEASAVLRSLIVALLLSAVLVLGLRALVRDGQRAALVASGIVLLVSSFGHVTRLAGTLIPTGPATAIIALLWMGALGGWSHLVLRRIQNPLPAGQYFLIVGLLLNILPLYNWASYARSSRLTDGWVEDYAATAAIEQNLGSIVSHPDSVSQDGSGPDIYLIVLDAYTRGDVLRDIYDYDNRPFLRALQDRGFFVAGESRANYSRTEPSIASTLNMMHLNKLPAAMAGSGISPSEPTVMGAASRLVRRNHLVGRLRAEGYTIVAFDGGYGGVYLEDPDVFRQDPQLEDANFWQVGFEVMLLDTALGRELTRRMRRVYSPLEGLFEAHRQRILYTLEHLPDEAGREGPQFVYAHVVSPHVPYVFGPNGERIESDDPFTLLNARPGAEDNIEKYRDQVHYLNGLVLEAIDGILATSDRPPVIILMGDHGSKVYSDPDPSQAVRRRLVFPILNAYHLPGAEADWLDPSITPVNSFRGVLNTYFEAGLPSAPDTSYDLIETDDGMRFVQVCGVEVHCP